MILDRGIAESRIQPPPDSAHFGPGTYISAKEGEELHEIIPEKDHPETEE